MGSENFKFGIKRVLNYKKPLFLIITIVIVILIIAITVATDIRNRPHVFEEITSKQVGDSYFLSEDQPETIQEELVYLNFLYTVEKNFDKKYEILANTEANEISIENEKSNTDPDIYTSYVIHKISTFNKSEQDTDEILKMYNLSEYEIVNTVYTQKHSLKLLTLGLQWGDGTYSRNFIVGKSKADKSYKIYDFVIPLGVEDLTQIESPILSSDICLYNYDRHELTAERTIIDVNSKINILNILSSGSKTNKHTSNDVPTVPNYIKIEINSNGENKVKESYFVYQINSKYYIEKPYVYINEITFDNYRDVFNLNNLGVVPNPIFISANLSELMDMEFSNLRIDGIENPHIDDFRKFEFKLYIEFPNNIKNRKVVPPCFDFLSNYKGENLYLSGSKWSNDNEDEPFALYTEDIVINVRGLNERNLEEIFKKTEANISWSDDYGYHEYKYNIGDVIVFEGESIGRQNSADIDINGFFDELISTETYKLEPIEDSDKLIQIFSKYCNDRGMDVLFKNSTVLKNYEIFEENGIESYDNLNVKLIEETSKEDAIYQRYKISYTYSDKNNNQYNLIDYYAINIKDNKIDYIKYDFKISSMYIVDTFEIELMEDVRNFIEKQYENDAEYLMNLTAETFSDDVMETINRYVESSELKSVGDIRVVKIDDMQIIASTLVNTIDSNNTNSNYIEEITFTKIDGKWLITNISFDV